MSIEELIHVFPLDAKAEAYMDEELTGFSNYLKAVGESQIKMQIPENVRSELCQIYFCVAISLDNLLAEKYNYGIEMIKSQFSAQVKIFEGNMLKMGRASIARGVSQDDILPYLCLYFDKTFRKIFPNAPLIFQ